MRKANHLGCPELDMGSERKKSVAVSGPFSELLAAMMTKRNISLCTICSFRHHSEKLIVTFYVTSQGITT